MCDSIGLCLRLRERFYHYQLVPPVIDDLHRDLPVVACLEGRADGSREMRPHAVLERAPERALEALPCRGPREERLADVEAESVVVRVEEPGRDVVPLPVVGIHRHGVEYVEAEQFDLVAPSCRWRSCFRRRYLSRG